MEKEKMKATDKHLYFQQIICDEPGFLKHPEDYPEYVYDFLFLFFKGDRIFDDFAICPGAEDEYDCVAIVDLQRRDDKVLYQVTKLKCVSYPGYKTQTTTVKGLEYLHKLIGRIFDKHIHRKAEDIFAELGKESRQKIGDILKAKSRVSECMTQESIPLAKAELMANALFIFFGRRDAEISFCESVTKIEYKAKIEYRKDSFMCTISENGLFDSQIILDTKTNKTEIKPASGETIGMRELECLIAEKIFVYL